MGIVFNYVHLNPARAKLLKPEQALREYRWSSWPEYLREPGKRPAWLRVDRVLGEAGVAKDSTAGRRELERRMEARRGAEEEAGCKEGDVEKVKIAARLRKETLVTVAWIAERLLMGSVANVNTFCTDGGRAGDRNSCS